MPQTKILIDTNTYIRLAKDLHPFLCVEFGEEKYCLYILREAFNELQNPKLENSFYWIEDDEFVQNRKKFPTIGRKKKNEVTINFEFLWDTAQDDEFIGPSETDVMYLAVAMALGVPVVTDDQAMIKLGVEFGIEMMTTVELLKLMHDCEHITLEEIDRILCYLNVYDRPSNLHEEYERLFGKSLV